MSPDRMSATSVAHKSTGGTLQSLPEPVDPVGDAPDYLTFKTVAPLRHSVLDVGYFLRSLPEICAYRTNLHRRLTMTVPGQSTLNYTWDSANRLTQIAQGTVRSASTTTTPTGAPR
jgi:hypothetical protein